MTEAEELELLELERERAISQEVPQIQEPPPESGTMTEALLPKFSKASEEDKPYLSQVLATGSDILSAPIRGAAAFGRSGLGGTFEEFGLPKTEEGEPIQQTFQESLEQINRGEDPRGEPSVISEVYQDPTILPLSATGVGTAGWVMKGGKWLPKVGRGAAVGAGEGLATGLEKQAEDVFLEGEEFSPAELGTEVAVGAAAPVAFDIFKGISDKIGAKAWNAIKGKFANASDAELVDLAEKFDVPLSYGDITGKTAKVETLAENVPVVGTSGFRREGAKKFKKAAEGVRERARKAMVETGEDITQDVDEIIQASGTKKARQTKKAASKLYDKVEKLSGDKAVKPMNAIDEADKILKELRESDVPEEGVSNFFQKTKENLESGDKTFTNLRKTRSALGKAANKAAMTDPNKARLIRNLRSSVEKDIEDVTKGGEKGLESAYRKATKFYKDEVVPLAEKKLVKSLSSNEPDQVYSQFIQRGKGDRAKNFYNALDEKGQAALRFKMIDEAFNKGTSESKKGVFSSAQFAKYLEDFDAPLQQVFKGKDKAEIEGIKKLMRAGERFGQFAENPPTGMRNIAAGLAAGTVGSIFSPAILKGMAAGGGLTAILKALTTTKKGRNYLLAANKLDPQSKGMEKLMVNINNYLTPRIRAAASQAGRSTAKE